MFAAINLHLTLLYYVAYLLLYHNGMAWSYNT